MKCPICGEDMIANVERDYISFKCQRCGHNFAKPIFALQIHNIIDKFMSVYKFYEKYMNNPVLLIEEHPEFENEVKKIYKLGEKIDVTHLFSLNAIYIGTVLDIEQVDRWLEELSKYNEWLYHVAFNDVLEEIKKRCKWEVKNE